jgi:hypothetical protein
LAGRDRPVRVVDHLRDHQVLEQMQAAVPGALGGDPAGLGGGVDVERRDPPRLCRQGPRLAVSTSEEEFTAREVMRSRPASCSSAGVRIIDA